MKISNYFKVALSVATLALLITMMSCNDTVNQPDNLTQVSGVLTDNFGMPVPNAVLEVISKSTGKVVLSGETLVETDTTGEDGSFSFSKLPSDWANLDLRIIHSDMKPFQNALSKVMEGKDKKNADVMLEYSDTCKGTVVIKVLNKKDSSVISGVEVRLNRGDQLMRKAKTNDNGEIGFENVCPNNYWVRLSKYGFDVLEEDGIRVEGENRVERTLYMSQWNENDSCCDGVIKVKPVDKANGQLLNGAVVKLRKGGAELTRLTVENEAVTFRELCEGTYGFLIVKDGYNAVEFEVTLGCNDTLDLTKELEKIECCNGVVTVNVKDSTGSGINMAWVRLWKSSTKLGEYKTNDQGQVILKNICKGTYQISLGREGYNAIEFNFEMACDDTMSFDKTLVVAEKDTCCNGVLKIKPVDDSTRVPLNGMYVQLFQGDKLLRKIQVVEGWAVFKELCKGKYNVVLSRDGYKSTDFTVELGCNETKEIERGMLKEKSNDSCCNGTLKVYLKKKDSDLALNGGKVKLLKGGLVSTYQIVEGGYVLFTKLCEGDYAIYGMMEGYNAADASIKIGCNEEKSYELYLSAIQKDTCCDNVVRVRVTDDEGNALNTTLVKLWKGSTNIKSLKTEGEGWVYFKELCKGEYGISMGRDGYKGKEFSFVVGCHDTLTYEKALARDTCCNAVLRLNIVNNDSNYVIEGALVRVFVENVLITQINTLGDGRAIFEKLCAPKRYRIVVEKEGYQELQAEFVYETCTQKEAVLKMLR